MFTTTRGAALGVALLCASALSGCSSSPGIHNPFPKPGELQALTSKPAPKEALPKQGKAVATWTLSGALPTRRNSAPISSGSPLEMLLRDTLKGASSVQATESMRCVAQQAGAFVIQHDKTPDGSLDDFITERCGTSVHSVNWQALTFELAQGQTLTQQELLTQRKDKLQELIKDAMPKQGPGELGITFAQQGARALVLVVSGTRKVTLDDGPMAREADGSFTLKGQLHVPGDAVYAMITRGAFGYGRCVTNEAVALPRFELRCQGDPNDPWTRVQLAASRRGELRSSGVLTTLALKPGAEVDTYTPSQAHVVLQPYLERPSPQRPEQRAGEFTELANLVRKQAGLEPLRLELSQTATAIRTAPHYFKATREDDRQTGDKLMLGLLAGWDITTPIADADFSSYITGNPSTAHLLLRMIEHPSGRETLLNPKSDRIAPGIIIEDGALGGVIATYEPLPKESHARRVSRALEKINAARTALGRKPLGVLTAHNHDAQKLADAISRGDKTVESAANDLGQLVMMRANQSARLLSFTLFSLDRIDQFKELTTNPAFEAAILVAPYRPEGFPWTIYAVVMVIPGNQRVAALPAPARDAAPALAVHLP